jgi:hypothetical protein
MSIGTNDGSEEPKPATAALELHRAGYTNMISILKHDAFPPPHKLEKLSGKAPGYKNGAGWRLSSGWQKRAHATEAEVESWLESGANIGHLTGRLIGLDIDDTASQRVERILEIHADVIGVPVEQLTVRWGRRPMVFVRLDPSEERLAKRRVDLTDADGKHSDTGYEVLGDGQQCVIAGTHPTTGAPYRVENLVRFDDLPIITTAQVDELVDRVREFYATETALAPSVTVARDAADAPDQDTLKAPRGVADVYDMFCDPNGDIRLPNTIDNRSKWIAVGAAMKASCASSYEWPNLETTFVLWSLEWNGEHVGGVDDIIRQWDSLRPPFSVGWNYLQGTVGKSVLGELVFTPVLEPTSLISPTRGLTLRYAPDFSLNNVPPQIVQGLLMQQSVALLYGPPNVGKSFVMLHLANCIATGTAFFGRKVKKGSVLYCALEGVGGFEKRGFAYQRRFEPGRNFAALLGHWSAFDDSKVDEVIQAGRDVAVASGAPLRLVIVDTVSKVMAGHEENSNSEVSLFLTRMGHIADALGATVLLVHHSGKDANAGARGGSAFKGNVDTEFELVASDKPGITGKLRASKLRDDDKLAANDHFYFLKPTLLWREDEWGEQMQTAILVEVDAPDTTVLSDAALPPRARALLELIVAMTEAAADDGPEIGAFNEASIEKSELRDAFVRDVMGVTPAIDGAQRDWQRNEFNRQLRTLKKLEKIEECPGARRGEAWVRHLGHASPDQSAVARHYEAPPYKGCLSASTEVVTDDLGNECAPDDVQNNRDDDDPGSANRMLAEDQALVTTMFDAARDYESKNATPDVPLKHFDQGVAMWAKRQPDTDSALKRLGHRPGEIGDVLATMGLAMPGDELGHPTEARSLVLVEVKPGEVGVRIERRRNAEPELPSSTVVANVSDVDFLQ